MIQTGVFMKKSALLLLGFLSLSSTAFAQENFRSEQSFVQDNWDPKTDQYKYHDGMGLVMETILSRFHSLDIEGQIQEMFKNSEKQRKVLFGITTTGSVVRLDSEDHLGLSMGEFVIKYTTGNRYAIAFSGMSIANDLNLSDPKANLASSILENIDMAVFHWDRGISFDGLNTFTLDLANVNLRGLIAKDSKRALFITAGGSGGNYDGDLTLASGEVIKFGPEQNGVLKNPESYHLNYRYGLGFDEKFKNDSRLDIRMAESNSYSKAFFYEHSDGSLQEITRRQTYLNPSIEFSTPINQAGKATKRLGMDLRGNIPLRDEFKGGSVNVDMKDKNRNLLNLKVFLNF
jgi:hypothetical protein